MLELEPRRMMGKYDVFYFQCSQCRFLTTERPYWLKEAYSSAISEYDVGLLRRNETFTRQCTPIFHLLMRDTDRGLDVSGGYGVFARMMRDRGFDFYTTDPYCENIFARGFEPDKGFEAKVLTLFETLEHLENPLGFLEENFRKYNAEYLMISTETYTGDLPPDDWWYYMPESGQHISFYTTQTMHTLASRLKCHCEVVSQKLTLFSKKPLTRDLLDLCRQTRRGQKLRRKISGERKGKSLTLQDHEALKNE